MAMLKSRIAKLEHRNNDSQQLAVIIVQFGRTQEQALNDWKAETGRSEPGRVVYIQRFSDAI